MRRFYKNRQRDLIQLFVERAAITKIKCCENHPPQNIGDDTDFIRRFN